MASVNKVIIIGNLGRDPEIRYSKEEMAICKLNIATTRTWTDKTSKEKHEETEWHRVTVFGKQGESCGKYLSKGRQCYVEGRLKTTSYEDKDGVKKYSTDIIADTVQFLGGKDGGSSTPSSGSTSDGGWKRPPLGPEDDDDVPF